MFRCSDAAANETLPHPKKALRHGGKTGVPGTVTKVTVGTKVAIPIGLT